MKNITAKSNFDSRLSVLQRRHSYLLELIEEVSKSSTQKLPDIFGSSGKDNGDIFTWVASKELQEMAAKASPRLELLLGMRDDLKEEIRDLLSFIKTRESGDFLKTYR